MGQTRTRTSGTGVSACAAGLAVMPHLAVLVAHGEPGDWLSMPVSLRNALAADALFYVALVVVIAAPVAGVAVVRAGDGRRDAAAPAWWQAAGAAAAPALAFTVVSALATIAWTWGRPGAGSFLVQSHVTIGLVATALCVFGAACGAWMRHPLDAIATTVLVALLGAGGLLMAGAAVADAPGWLIAGGLTASPLVVIASAAQIDLVRMDLFYQISPLAHRQMSYPSWLSAAAWYAAVACTSVGAIALAPKDRRGARADNRAAPVGSLPNSQRSKGPL